MTAWQVGDKIKVVIHEATISHTDGAAELTIQFRSGHGLYEVEMTDDSDVVTLTALPPDVQPFDVLVSSLGEAWIATGKTPRTLVRVDDLSIELTVDAVVARRGQLRRIHRKGTL